MVEELLKPAGQVLAIAALAKIMSLVVVLEQPCRLAKAAKVAEELDSLIPRNCTIGIIVHDKNRSGNLVYEEYRRILYIKVKTTLIPQRLADTALTVLILHCTGHTTLPTDTAVSTGHVAHRSTCASGTEHIGTGNKVCGLIATPALALDSHMLLVDNRELLAHGLSSGANTIISALAGMTGFINDIRDKYSVTVTYIHGYIHGRT